MLLLGCNAVQLNRDYEDDDLSSSISSLTSMMKSGKKVESDISSMTSAMKEEIKGKK